MIPDSVIFGFSNGGTFIKLKAVQLVTATAKALLGRPIFAQKGLSADLAFTIQGLIWRVKKEIWRSLSH